jgi:phage terminase small subunit
MFRSRIPAECRWGLILTRALAGRVHRCHEATRPNGKETAMVRLGSRAALSAKQKRFVGEYLVDLNATRAAIRAGYSRKTARKSAYQLLQRTPVAEAIATAQAELAGKVGVTVENIVVELARIAFSDIRDVVQWRSLAPETETETDDGEPHVRINVVELKSADDLTPDVAAAIAEVSQQPNGGLRVKLHDKRAALVDLGRHLGMFAERREHASTLRVEIVRFGQDEGSG